MDFEDKVDLIDPAVDATNGHGDLNAPGLSEDQKKKLEDELYEVEHDIQMLKETLHLKTDRANAIRRQLGITQLAYMQNMFKDQMHQLQESTVYQKTASALSQAREKTVEIATNVKNSEQFKTAENKIESLMATVKSAIVKGTYGTNPEEGE